MCIIIVAVMFLLLYHLIGMVDHLQLIEVIDQLPLPIANGWDVLVALWPAMLLMFLAGILVMLLIFKFMIKSPDSSVKT